MYQEVRIFAMERHDRSSMILITFVCTRRSLSTCSDTHRPRTLQIVLLLMGILMVWPSGQRRLLV